MRVASASSKALASFLIVTGVGGLVVNLIFYRGDAVALWLTLGAIALYATALLIGLGLLVSPRLQRRGRGLVLTCVYGIVCGDVMRVMASQHPDTTVWIIFIPMCGAAVVAALARTWSEVIALAVFSGGVLLLGAALGFVPVMQAATATTAVAIGGIALTISTAVRLQTQAHLVRLNEDLVSLNTDLSAAREEAEAAVRAKSDFLATMSHEIRTPMNGVVGMAEILAATSLGDEQDECVRTIQTSADALLSIINDVLDVSKIEAGRMEIEAAPFEPERLVRDALAVVRPQAGALALRVEAVAPLPATVLGDATRVRQVVLNLLSNAAKFTHDGGVTLRLSAPGHVDGRVGPCRLQVDVVDTGIGIAPERREALFDAFTQADASTTRTYGGTGLGLTISRQLVGLMGGALRVESTPGVGSTFSFDVQAEAVADRPLPAEAESVPLPLDASTRILLAEDHVVNQRVALRLLQQFGLDADVAADGAAALAALHQAHRRGAPYDLVLMDIQMPVLDGYEATRRLRAELPPSAQPRVIALTANALGGDREACLEAGADAYLAKPVQRATLQAALAGGVASHEVSL